MEKQLHTVLGGHGAIGRGVISELAYRRIPFRAVERKKDVPGVKTVKADLLDLEQSIQAVKDSTHVYLCVGVPYNAKIWEVQWPLIMKNVITACEKANARLVFLDNIYMYGPTPLSVPFDENHSQNPQAKKGKTRKLITDMVLDAHQSQRIKAVIGRASDFFGPNATNSMFYSIILQRMMKNKPPQWLGKANVKHTYSYTGDVARALVALALDEKTYGQVWHTPVGKPVSIEEIIAIMNRELNTNFKVSIMPEFMFAILSIFIPILGEVKEMLYQFNEEYIMSDKKFKNHFPEFKSTNFEDGIHEMIESFKNNI